MAHRLARSPLHRPSEPLLTFWDESNPKRGPEMGPVRAESTTACRVPIYRSMPPGMRTGILSFWPGRVAAARELLEETGLDMRESMHRLVPVDFEAMGVKGQKLHQSRRRFFRLDINDSDSVDDIPGGDASHSPLTLFPKRPLSTSPFPFPRLLCLLPPHPHPFPFSQTTRFS